MHIAPLLRDNPTRFDAFYDIYRVSFPPSEQKSKEALLAMYTLTSYTIFIAEDDEIILGFCIVFHDKDADFYLLEYMAVDPQRRDLGIGSQLFNTSYTYIQERYGLKPLLVEIDSPKSPSLDKALREKRAHFYRKLGAKTIDALEYILPLKSTETPPAMQLLLYHPTLNSIAKQTLQRWLEQLYTNVYGCEANDARIKTMLHHAPELFHLI